MNTIYKIIDFLNTGREKTADNGILIGLSIFFLLFDSFKSPVHCTTTKTTHRWENISYSIGIVTTARFQYIIDIKQSCIHFIIRRFT